MKDTTTEQILGIPPLVIAPISCICNIYVSVVAYQVRQQIKRTYGRYGSDIERLQASNDYVFMSLIFYLPIIDTLSCLFFVTNIIEHLYQNSSNISHINPIECTIIGIGSHFFWVLGILWHIILASYLFYLIMPLCPSKSSIAAMGRNIDDIHGTAIVRGSKQQNVKTKKPSSKNVLSKNLIADKYASAHTTIAMTDYNVYYLKNPKVYSWTIFCAFVVAILLTVVPLTIGSGNSYISLFNYYNSDRIGFSQECWMDGFWQLLFLIPVIISLLLHYIILILAFIKFSQTRWFTRAYWYLIKRLIPWVALHSVIRILPAAARAWRILYNKYTVPLWLVIAHHIAIVSMGIANLGIWYLNRKIKRTSNVIDSQQIASQNHNHYNQTIFGISKNNSNKNKNRYNNIDNNNNIIGQNECKNNQYNSINAGFFGIQNHTLKNNNKKGFRFSASGNAMNVSINNSDFLEVESENIDNQNQRPSRLSNTLKHMANYINQSLGKTDASENVHVENIDAEIERNNNNNINNINKNRNASLTISTNINVSDTIDRGTNATTITHFSNETHTTKNGSNSDATRNTSEATDRTNSSANDISMDLNKNLKFGWIGYETDKK